MNAAIEPADREVLAHVAAGDRAAFESALPAARAWLRCGCDGGAPTPTLVDEVVQETFVAVWRGGPATRHRRRSPAGSGGRDPAAGRRAPPAPGRRARWPGAPRSSPRPRSRCCSVSSTATWAGRSSGCRRAARRRTGDRARRADHQGGRPPARHPGRHRQDAEDARPRPAAGGAGMTTACGPTADRAYAAADSRRGRSRSRPTAGCGGCRAGVAGLVGAGRSRGWDGVDDASTRRAAIAVERLLGASACPTTPPGCSPRRRRCALSWLIAVGARPRASRLSGVHRGRARPGLPRRRAAAAAGRRRGASAAASDPTYELGSQRRSAPGFYCCDCVAVLGATLVLARPRRSRCPASTGPSPGGCCRRWRSRSRRSALAAAVGPGLGGEVAGGAVGERGLAVSWAGVGRPARPLRRRRRSSSAC